MRFVPICSREPGFLHIGPGEIRSRYRVRLLAVLGALIFASAAPGQVRTPEREENLAVEARYLTDPIAPVPERCVHDSDIAFNDGRRTHYVMARTYSIQLFSTTPENGEFTLTDGSNP